MTDDRKKVSTKITVKTKSACEIEKAQPKILIEKDENLSTTSCFDSTKPFYFRVYHNADSVDVFATDGQVSHEGNEYEELEEIVVFSCSNTASTSKPLKSIITYQWLGRSLGSITVQDNGDLKIANIGYGVLKVTYKTYYEIYSLRAMTEGDVMIVATTGSEDCEEGASSATYTIKMGCKEDYRQVKINVKNYLTGEAVPFATVSIKINNQWQTYTCDQFGSVDIGMLQVGTYDIKVVKEDYIPSDTDTLNNDKFQVQ